MVCDEQKRNCKTVYIIYNKPLFSALGVAFTKHGELGVSPISSIANIMSYRGSVKNNAQNSLQALAE